jgi:hypothetical protein
MNKMSVFEILQVLGVLEVEQHMPLAHPRA